MNISRSICVVLSLALAQGCAVFEPVGDFFSLGYQNTVAYFNAYYNASRLFSEAEQEYADAYRTHQNAVREGATADFKLPSTATQKFSTVIDKCSNILTFRSQSGYVEDALFLIARSYDYMGETVKAERKYAELLQQYPDTEYRIEAVARLGGVMLQQQRIDEARELLEQAETEAIAVGDEDVLPFILERLAVLNRDEGDLDRALEYYARLHALSSDNEELVSALLDYARLQLQTGNNDDALRITRNVADLTDDPFYLTDARSLELQSLRNLDRLDEALARVEETLGDFRFLQQEGVVRLMRAGILMDLGREKESTDEFILVDTTYARKNPGAAAAFALGEYYMDHGRYEEARAEFDRAAAVASSPVSQDARRRSASTARYIGLQNNLLRADSVLTALQDSVGVGPDPGIDSMRTMTAAIMQDMGDWHYSERVDRDSAYYWLKRSVETVSARPGQARALFILADLAGGAQDSAYGDPMEYYRRIHQEFPRSIYAEEARMRLGIVLERQEDPGYQVYRRAEQLLEEGRHADAARAFDSLNLAYPGSGYATQSTFAAGWIYEYFLERQDSASARYRKVVETGGSSPFVKEAQSRIAAIRQAHPLPAVSSESDTVLVPAPLRDSLRTEQELVDSVRATPSQNRLPVIDEP